jgi:hypothetical protein
MRRFGFEVSGNSQRGVDYGETDVFRLYLAIQR